MKRAKKIYNRYKEYILYVVFGGFTTIISWGVFYVCTHIIKMDVVPGNIISWILAVAFAYATNRKWVFESKARGLRPILKEIIEFTAGRLVTLGIETAALWLTVDILKWNDMVMKILISIIVLILNYVFSKFIAFRQGK